MRRDRPKRGIEKDHFNKPLTGSLAGAVIGFISSLFAQVAAAMLGLNFGLVDPWSTLAVGGVISGIIIGGGIGYRLNRRQQKASWLVPLLVLVAGFGGSLLIAGVNRAGGVTFTCQRLESARIDCQLIEQRWAEFRTERAESFEGVQTANIEPLSGDVGYLPVLVTTQGEVGLYGFDLDLVDQIKRFTDSTETSLIIAQDDWPASLIVLAVGGCLFLIGCAGVWLAPSEKKAKIKKA